MSIQLPNLPYTMNALEPYISEETLTYHYGKHHAAYVKNTNDLINGTDLDNNSLTEIILTAASDTIYTNLFNNAAQSFNHEFFWKSLSPTKTEPSQKLLDRIKTDFGSLEEFKAAFLKLALSQFGSGWAWLVSDNSGVLTIMTTSNAGTPITRSGINPLLCLDVWEHAYYLDYQNRRADYLKAIIDNLLNWEFASQNFQS